MKKVTTLIATTVAATALFAGASAFAMRDGHGMMDGESHGSRMAARLGDRLELDEGQAAALDALQVQLSETRELMRAADLRSQLNELVSGESFDQAAALALINERTAALNTKAPEVVAAAAAFFDNLTPEQKTELQSLMQKRGRFGHDRGEHGERGGRHAR